MNNFNIYFKKRSFLHFREFPTALEIIKYIPLGDISGYLIQLEHNKLYAREVIFHFATGFLEEVSKHLLIEGCDKLRDVDSISYLESTKHLVSCFFIRIFF